MTNLTRSTQRWLYALIVITSIYSAFDLFSIQFINGILQGENVTVLDAEQHDRWQGMLAFLYFVIYITAGIFVLRWLYKAKQAVLQQGAQNTRFSPAWSIGWYFIPIANLWKPYQAMKELWKTSANPQQWANQTTPGLLGWWWFLWLATNILGNIIFKLTRQATELNTLMALSAFDILVNILIILLTLTLISIMNQIQQMQSGFSSVMSNASVAPSVQIAQHSFSNNSSHVR